MTSKLPPMWRVELAEHDVARWHVRARSAELPAPDGAYARARVVRWAHADAGVPSMRSLVRASMGHVTATPSEGEVGVVVELARAA
jgi:hypothetical protein